MSQTKVRSILVSLGSNLPFGAGQSQDVILAALNILSLTLRKDLLCSPLYRTPAFPKGSGPDFVNAAAMFQSDQDPAAILRLLHDIEAEFDRERAVRWGARTLDIDLLAAGAAICPDQGTVQTWIDLPFEDQKTQAPSRLILPHPRLQDRGFVLVPLAQIAPDWTHPILGRSIQDMAAALDLQERAEIQQIEGTEIRVVKPGQ